MHFFLVAHCLIFSHNQPFRLGGRCTWPGGDAQGGEGGCTCILCIPPGYAPVITYPHRIQIHNNGIKGATVHVDPDPQQRSTGPTAHVDPELRPNRSPQTVSCLTSSMSSKLLQINRIRIHNNGIKGANDLMDPLSYLIHVVVCRDGKVGIVGGGPELALLKYAKDRSGGLPFPFRGRPLSGG